MRIVHARAMGFCFGVRDALLATEQVTQPQQTVIYGEVTLYRKEGRLFDNYRNATRYELIVACRIRLRDGSGGDGVFYSGELAARTEFAESEGAVETERRARGRLLRQLAAQIHQAIEIAVADRASAPASAPDGQR